MAILTENETRTRYQWLWTITKIYDGDEGHARNVPMQVGDRLFIFFISDREVCFHRRGRKGFDNDPGWEEALGVYSPKTNEIVGQIVSTEGFKTDFTIRLDTDEKSGKRIIVGSHRYNPGAGGWRGDDETGG
ncbi:MAG: hypothetical protein AAFX44_15890 [Pseudomonadota bacterium]